MKKRMISLLLALALCLSLLPVMAMADAIDIRVTNATYYDSGALKSITATFGWSGAETTCQLALMTTELKPGADGGHGDFTNFGNYANKHDTFKDVLADDERTGTFGIISYTNEQSTHAGSATFTFNDTDIPLSVDKTYYVVVWTTWGSYGCYPDNLVCAIRVKDGKIEYAVAEDNRIVGDFKAPDSEVDSDEKPKTEPDLPWWAGLLPALDDELPFTDVQDGDWFYDDVCYVYKNGLMNGTSATKFSPSASTTRGMVLTILARMEGVNTSGTPWYAAGRDWAVANGISDGTNMEAPVTREQLAAILYRYASFKGRDAATLERELSAFADADSVSGWALDAMQWAVGTGLISGSNGLLRPQSNASRAEVAAILARLCEQL